MQAAARVGIGAASLAAVGASSAEAVDSPAEDSSDAEAAAGETNEVVRGGALRFAMPTETHDYFDPHRAFFAPTQFWMGLYMNHLIRWRNEERGVMEADIASLPEMPDDETYVFRLDRGARFWDRFPTDGGRQVTAEDIRVNFQRQIEDFGIRGFSDDGHFHSARAFHKTASMETPDRSTFVAKTNGADATYLGATALREFSWITSPEAIGEFGDRWRDESHNIALSSGTGMMIPLGYYPEQGLLMARNPDYWKTGLDGQPLPYFDLAVFYNINEPEAIESAYRRGYLSSATLSREQIDGILADLPDHQTAETASGFTIVTSTGTYDPAWEGSDGLDNPYADRRFAYAMHLAVDRDLMIDAVYSGEAKLSATSYCPWFSTGWTIPPDELRAIPGFRANRQEDVQLCRELIAASGFDTTRTVTIYIPDIWEQTYPGISETTQNMYEDALGFNVDLDIQPYFVFNQRWVEGSFPGHAPAWTNPPRELDPTAAFAASLKVGGTANYAKYSYAPVEEIVDRMTVTFNVQERRELARRVQRIGLGADDEHGLDGIFDSFGVMNLIRLQVQWPYVNNSEDVYQWAHASHRHDETWLDTAHADYPA